MSSIPALITADNPIVGALYRIAVMQAAHDRQTVQGRLRSCETSVWSDLVDPVWNWGAFDYRIKPTPAPKVLRAWCMDEVPISAVLRYKSPTTASHRILHRFLIISHDHQSVHVAGYGIVRTTLLMEDFEHSTDGGKTWLPCGTYES